MLFTTPIPAMFGIKRYSDALEQLRVERNVKAMFNTQLLSVDGKERTAVLKTGDKITSQRFDLLHVSPPMSSPDCISSSPLADAAGFVEVDKNTLQHVRFPNVFAAGDVASTPNSKTAVRLSLTRARRPFDLSDFVVLLSGSNNATSSSPCAQHVSAHARPRSHGQV